MLTAKVENLKVDEDDIVAIFNGKMIDIANQAFQLGKKYSNEKFV